MKSSKNQKKNSEQKIKKASENLDAESKSPTDNAVSIPDHLSVTELAWFADITDRQIYKIEKGGHIHRDRTKKFPTDFVLKELILYYKNLTSSSDKMRIYKAKADLIEIEVEEKKGILITEDDAKTLISKIIAPLRKRLDEQATRLCKLCNPHDHKLAYDVIEEDNKNTLTKLKERYESVDANNIIIEDD